MHISNRKQFAGRALKMIAFVLLTVLLLVGMSKTLVPRSNSASGGMHNYRARGFYGEEKDSLDVVAIGNSDLASGFSPMELWKTHGISGFACGEPNQTIDQSVRLLQEVLTCQRPKVVPGDGRPFPGKHGRSSDLIGQDRSQLSFSGIGIS